ncbi:MAG: hypothetical protein PHU34_09225 [Candidatus Methanoperedens sp.]|nr:hypothetical protein [Candidatus Methanoperedens sp.]
MTFDIKTLALANLVIQTLLVIMVSGASYLAKKRDLKRHCAIIRIAVPIQIIAVAAVMLPSMLGYIRIVSPAGFFNIEMLLHHTLGLSVIAVWIYINMVSGKLIRMPRNFAAVMRLAFILWILAFFLGLHLYVTIWI